MAVSNTSKSRTSYRKHRIVLEVTFDEYFTAKQAAGKVKDILGISGRTSKELPEIGWVTIDVKQGERVIQAEVRKQLAKERNP